jgi:hypothetical protein
MSASDRVSAQVWRLVSGFPSRKREKRVFMLLQPQCCIDDSGSEPSKPHFILAGFAAPAAQWAAFADEWQAALDEPPKLDYFKMKEAAKLQDQFAKKRGWDELKRDDRLITVTRIINKYVMARPAVHSAMPSMLHCCTSHLKRRMKKISCHYRHQICMLGSCEATTRSRDRRR